MVKKLSLCDFKPEVIEGTPYMCFKVDIDKISVYLEPCLNGVDVALYDKNLDLIFPKICTNMYDFSVMLVLKKAVKIANKLLKKYYKSLYSITDK
jgi:hypothetical protein